MFLCPAKEKQYKDGLVNRAAVRCDPVVEIVASWGAASSAPTASSFVGSRCVTLQNANREIGVPKVG
jgi:hypothetical protein